MCRKIVLLFGLLACMLLLPAQESYKFRVQLIDKVPTVYSLDRPEEFLSEKALQRRERQGLVVDSTDLPVCKEYINQLIQLGGKYVTSSKWNNTVVMEVPDEGMAQKFLDQPFVRSIKRVWVSPDTVFPRRENRKKEVKNEWKKVDDYYGVSEQQVKIHHGDSLHQAGFRGQGMEIAVIDAGFYNADVIKYFKSIKVRASS